MIVESRNTIMNIFDLSQQHTEVYVIPIFTDLYKHPNENTLSCIYIASKAQDFIIPINHPDSDIQFTIEQVEGILSKFSYIYVNDKKEFLHAFKWGKQHSRKIIDLNMAGWFVSNKPTDISQITTTAHDFIERRHSSLPRVNTVIPYINTWKNAGALRISRINSMLHRINNKQSLILDITKICFIYYMVSSKQAYILVKV